MTATTNVPLPTLHPWRPRHPHTRGHSLPPATPLPTPRPLHHRVYFPPTAFFIPNVRATVRCHDIAPTLRGARAVVARASKLCVVVMLLECWTCVFEVLSVETRSVAGDLLVLRNKKMKKYFINNFIILCCAKFIILHGFHSVFENFIKFSLHKFHQNFITFILLLFTGSRTHSNEERVSRSEALWPWRHHVAP